MRSSLKCLFVCVCSWAFRDLCFYLPHLSASVDAFLFSGHAYVCGVWLSIEYLFAFRHPVMGFWVVFLIYCLLEQIEGDAVKCGHNFQWHNQEKIDFIQINLLWAKFTPEGISNNEAEHMSKEVLVMHILETLVWHSVFLWPKDSREQTMYYGMLGKLGFNPPQQRGCHCLYEMLSVYAIWCMYVIFNQ